MSAEDGLILTFQPGVQVERQGGDLVVVDVQTARSVVIPGDPESSPDSWVPVGDALLPAQTAADMIDDGLIVGAARRGALRGRRLRALLRMDSPSLRVFDRLLDHRHLHVNESATRILIAAAGRSLRTRWLVIVLLVALAVALILAGIPVSIAAVPPAAVAMLAVSVGVHEAAHLIALRRLPGHARSGALHVAASRPRLVRPDLAPKEAAGVAAAGPLAGAAAAAILAVTGIWGWWWVLVAILIAVTQLTSLLPMFDDGRQLAASRGRARQPIA